METSASLLKHESLAPTVGRTRAGTSACNHRQLLSDIVEAYDSRVIRAYCKARFKIININILDMLALCLRGKRRVLDIGCGFGLFGCYFASMYPEISYVGYDLNPERVRMADQSAKRLKLDNVDFRCGDVRGLEIEEQYDAIMMIDLLHHINDEAKLRLLDNCARRLSPEGRLIIKDVNTHPFLKIAFTWALDVLMTKSFEMWYWDEQKFYEVLRKQFARVDNFPITDLLPYPHVIYLSEKAPLLSPEAASESIAQPKG